MIYEISLQTSTNWYSTTQTLPSMAEAVKWTKNFGQDWHKGADYCVFCWHTGEWAHGAI